LTGLSSLSSAQELIKNSSPNEYLVKKGDTLWDIAGVFLKSPWKWPSIWEKNSQISNPDLIYPNDVIYLLYRDGKPYLSTSKDGEGRLSPRVRQTDRFSPITAIPRIALKSFVEDHRIVEAQRISKMPYILAGVGLRELISKGDEVFIRGVLDPEFNEYHIYREGKTYGKESGLLTDNTEIIRVGTLSVLDKQGDISRAEITTAKGLVRKGDFLVRSQALPLMPLYYLAAAPEEVNGKIIGAVNDAYQIARYDGVVINLGASSGIYAGHVFNVLTSDKSVEDPRTNELVAITNQKIAELMVVNVFENVSYGIILSASNSVSTGNLVETVK
jgi:hypothetical protein